MRLKLGMLQPLLLEVALPHFCMIEKFLGHVVSKDGLSPITSRFDDIKKLKSPESKVLGVVGVMRLYNRYTINFHVDAKCLSE